MSNPIYDLYCHDRNKPELLSKILLYKFEHISKKGIMCVAMIPFSQPGFMGSKV
jgi:hypothetical protein